MNLLEDRRGKGGGFWLALAVLILGFAIAALALRTPAPAPMEAPATEFSAARAMVDIRRIAQRPHPTASAENLKVATYLTRRMEALGLKPAWQENYAAGDEAIRLVRTRNIVGVLPGRERGPAVLLMAHYDTTAKSPGAADDTAGVAAVLEAVRAITARGAPKRDVIVVFTDGEELGLYGSLLFFEQHPLAARVGAVVNLEARGGGGRALMFETGPGNAETVRLFARAAGKASGGASSNSLAVFVYRQMPNGSDFTRAVKRGLPGVNIAFLGRPGQYHTPRDTPDRLDRGSVQHLGSQALEMADALARAPTLPKRGENLVYGDVFGLGVLRYPPGAGWLVLALAAAMIVVTAWQGRRAGSLTLADVGRGAIDAIWFLTAGGVLIAAGMVFLRPHERGQAQYYALLERLYLLESGAVAATLIAGVVFIAGRRRLPPKLAAAGLAIATVGGLMANFSVRVSTSGVIVTGAALLVAGLAACGLTLARNSASSSGLAGGLGAACLVLPFAVAAQVLAPEAALLLAWPLFAAGAVGLCVVSSTGRIRTIAAGAIGAAATAWLIAQGHFLFLGVGADLPAITLPVGLLALMILRPLAANHERLNQT